MTKIYIVVGEHQTTPGIRISAHKTDDGAQKRAAELVGMMLGDGPFKVKGKTDPAKWEVGLGWLQERFGAAHCDVGISCIELED